MRSLRSGAPAGASRASHTQRSLRTPTRAATHGPPGAACGGSAPAPRLQQAARVPAHVLPRFGGSAAPSSACRASSAGQATDERARRAELVKGCKTVLTELAGLDFSRQEAQRYVAYAVKPPPKYPGFDVKRASAALDAILAPAGDDDGQERTQDTEALVVLNAMLSDVWRWQRRGGFGASDEDSLPHVQALQALQGIDLTGTFVQEAQGGERVTSSLLDSLPMSDAEKTEMSGVVQKVALGAINGAVWGSLVVILGFLVLFNFVRG